MLDEYQAQAQEIRDLLEQVRHLLEELRGTLSENYPEEERTFRMGQAMKALDQVNTYVAWSCDQLDNIQWPTEDRPR